MRTCARRQVFFSLTLSLIRSPQVHHRPQLIAETQGATTYQYSIGPRPFSFPSALCSLSSPHTEESTSTLHSSDTHSNTSDEAGQRRGRARRIGLPLRSSQKACSGVQQTFEVVERFESRISQRLQGDDARCHKNHSIHKNNKNKKMHIRSPGMRSRR